MARFSYKMPDDFLQKVSRLGTQTDRIVTKVLKAGGEVVLNKARGNLRSVIGKGTKEPSRSTGELLSSLGLSPVKQDRDGAHNIKVGFSEPRRGKNKGTSQATSNAMVATILEYGKQGQPGKPFMKPARASSRKQCVATMKDTLDEEISKL